MKRFDTVCQRADLEALVKQVGILPFFSNHIPGWSLQENIDPAIWFTDREGPWEWKGPLAYEKVCVYGKFIRNKAAFVSPEWFAELANYRREGMTFEERVEAGEAPYRDQRLYETIAARPGELSKYLKRECGFSTGYDGVLTRLQMQTYVIDQDFRYSVDRHGKPYGWGNAALILPEVWLGEGFLTPAEGREPEESLDRIVGHLLSVMPDADEAALRREVK
jgi:hypothetical protein